MNQLIHSIPGIVTEIDGRQTTLLSEYKDKQDMFAHMRDLGGIGTKFTCIDRKGRSQHYLVTEHGYVDTRNIHCDAILAAIAKAEGK